MIFDKPIYENLSYKYIDFIYYYLLQKSYNAVISNLYDKINGEISYEYENKYVSTRGELYSETAKENRAEEEEEQEIDPIPNMIRDFYSRYFNVATAEKSQINWEKIFDKIEVELHYFYDIHKEYYKDFENDTYPEHSTHPSNPIYTVLDIYSTNPVISEERRTLESRNTEEYSMFNPKKTRFRYSHAREPTPIFLDEKTNYINKIKNRIIIDIRKLFALDFNPSYEQAIAMPSHILSIYKHLPPTSIHFYNYVAIKTTRNYFLEAMSISNIMAWL